MWSPGTCQPLRFCIWAGLCPGELRARLYPQPPLQEPPILDPTSERGRRDLGLLVVAHPRAHTELEVCEGFKPFLRNSQAGHPRNAQTAAEALGA